MATFRSVLATESHWLQPLLVLTVRWSPAPVSVGGLLDNKQDTSHELQKSCRKMVAALDKPKSNIAVIW